MQICVLRDRHPWDRQQIPEPRGAARVEMDEGIPEDAFVFPYFRSFLDSLRKPAAALSGCLLRDLPLEIDIVVEPVQQAVCQFFAVSSSRCVLKAAALCACSCTSR